MSLSKEKLMEIFGKEQYTVKLFEEVGYMWKTCKKCGHNFWTLDSDRDICGETVCEGGYKFLGSKTAGGWDFHESIERWYSFFERNGHKRIKEYPIVSRWRDDMDFTIASIADFQPWVLNGTIDPPGNPLVVAQPCLRFGGEFSDIDNIGKTGRHLTCFVMGGQHAFNSKRLTTGYWMDRCIEHNFKFLTEDMQIPKEEIIYMPSVWVGGGNFGPSLESFSRGNEIVNSVFTQYEILPDGSYREMDMTVIDVGWGLERIAWFTQGTPTIYEATFGPVLEWMIKETGVEVDKDLSSRYSVLAGLLNVDEVNISEARKDVAIQLEMTYEELEEKLGPIEALYAIADHTRALVSAVADGAIPSNVGGGYNLRTILRRAVSLAETFNLEIDLVELMHKQIEYFSKSYPRLKKASNIIEELFEVEKNSYGTTMEKGRTYVRRLLEKKEKITEDMLYEMYRSRGITPEMVKEIAELEERGEAVSIPGNFYTRATITEPVAATKMEEEEEEVEDLAPKVKGLPPTQPLYYEERYRWKLEAKILKIINDKYLVLDKTIFYPIGGGQLYDTGSINGREVEEVFKVGKVVLHQLSDVSGLKEGDTVEGELDWNRRIALMRHHTGTHVLNGAAKRVLGEHIWQVGADKTPQKARLDVSHFKRPTPEQVEEIERLSNEAVMKNLKVTISEVERDKAEEQYGFVIYQGGAVPGKILRIIDIDDWDVEACGGVHLSQTGEAGLIKISKVERISDGVVRFEFHAGEPAIEYIQGREKLLEETAKSLRVPVDQVIATSERFFNEWKQRGKEVEKLREKIANIYLEKIEAEAEEVDGIKTYVNLEHDLGKDEMIMICTRLGGKKNFLLILLGIENSNITLVGTSPPELEKELRKVMNEASKMIGGGAGGKKGLIIGGGTRTDKTKEALEFLKEKVKRIITKKSKEKN
ncbi:MAG: alanine--tRNA ligase [Candidatus Hodarchaeota archaeon]